MMVPNKTSSGYWCLFAALFVAWALPALAQEQLEEVIVTGSLIARPADRPQPVTVLGAEDLANEQRANLGEIFMDMSISQGGSALNSGPTSPTSYVNLRGVGARATLVLLDGRRQTVDCAIAGGSAAVDINNLAPSIMLERVEVLTDGASALYGSDAVAGVVNLITRRNFEGAEISVRGMELDRTGTGESIIGAIFGTSVSEDTSIVAGFEYTERDLVNTDMLFDDDRLSISVVSSSGNPGSFTPVGQSSKKRFADPLCGDSATLGRGQADSALAAGIKRSMGRGGSGGYCGLQLSLGRNQVAETERLVGLVVIDHAFGDGLEAKIDMGFARTRFETNFGFGLPILWNGALTGQAVVPKTNPGTIAENTRSGVALDDYKVNYRMVSPADPRGPQSYRTEQDTIRLAGVLNGEINQNWGWQVAGTFSQSDATMWGKDVLPDRFEAALNGKGGPADDQFWNPWANSYLASKGDANYNDPALRDWILVDKNTDGTAELSTLDFLVTGEIGEMAGGPTGLAVGLQTREQSFGLDFDPLQNDGYYAFRPLAVPDYSGTRTADSIYAEMVMFPSDTFEVQLAARKEDYGTVDSVNPKLGLLWTPAEGVFIRATAGSAFRIPGELQTFGQSVSRGPVGGELGGELVDAGARRVGNPDLLPEESDNLTFGVTWDVTDSFSLDLNYWKIEFKNLVVAEDADVVWNNDLKDGYINDPRIILRTGAPNKVSEMVAADIAGFEFAYINQDFQNTDGLDFNFDYRFSAGANDFGINLSGTKTLGYEMTTEGAVFEGVGYMNHSNLGIAMPELMARLTLDWRGGPHYLRLTSRHVGAVEEDSLTEKDTTSFDYNTYDLLYNFSLNEGRGNFNVAVINATDEETPRDGTTLGTNLSGTWDPRGRMYRVGFNWGF